MKRLSLRGDSADKDENWSPDGMISMLEAFKDKPIGKVRLQSRYILHVFRAGSGIH